VLCIPIPYGTAVTFSHRLTQGLGLSSGDDGPLEQVGHAETCHCVPAVVVQAGQEVDRPPPTLGVGEAEHLAGVHLPNALSPDLHVRGGSAPHAWGFQHRIRGTDENSSIPRIVSHRRLNLRDAKEVIPA